VTSTNTVHVRDATSDSKPHLEPNEGLLLPGAKVPDALVSSVFNLSS
jgi:hypothetical protein